MTSYNLNCQPGCYFSNTADYSQSFFNISYDFGCFFQTELKMPKDRRFLSWYQKEALLLRRLVPPEMFEALTQAPAGRYSTSTDLTQQQSTTNWGRTILMPTLLFQCWNSLFRMMRRRMRKTWQGTKMTKALTTSYLQMIPPTKVPPTYVH